MKKENRGGVRTSLTKKLSTKNITKQLKITDMKATKISKKEVKQLYEAGKLKPLMMHIISDGTKSDIIDALQLLINCGGSSETIKFESLPYSRGGKYARHTSTLTSVQSWQVCRCGDDGDFYITKESTSKSANCPNVVVPKFFTEKGQQFHNSIIRQEIESLKRKLI